MAIYWTGIVDWNTVFFRLVVHPLEIGVSLFHSTSTLARVTWLCSGWLVVHYVHKRESVFPKDMDNQPEKYSRAARAYSTLQVHQFLWSGVNAIFCCCLLLKTALCKPGLSGLGKSIKMKVVTVPEGHNTGKKNSNFKHLSNTLHIADLVAQGNTCTLVLRQKAITT